MYSLDTVFVRVIVNVQGEAGRAVSKFILRCFLPVVQGKTYSSEEILRLLSRYETFRFQVLTLQANVRVQSLKGQGALRSKMW